MMVYPFSKYAFDLDRDQKKKHDATCERNRKKRKKRKK